MSSAPATGTAPVALALDEVEVVYRVRGVDRPVLRGVSLEIGRAESYGLVGESGCGKSTAALSIVRYLPRNGRVRSGSISVAGNDVLSLGGRDLRQLHLIVSSDNSHQVFTLHVRHCPRRNQDGPFFHCHLRPEHAIPAWAQHVVRIREEGTYLERTSGGVDLPVSQGKLPLVGIDAAVSQDQLKGYFFYVPAPLTGLEVLLFPDVYIYLYGVHC